MRRLRAGSAGVDLRADLQTAYRVCLWSRLASRVLAALSRFRAGTPETLYQGIRGIDWDRHLDADGTLAVTCVTAHSALSHTQYAAQVVKDAIVDQLRERHGVRPGVDREAPGLRLNVYIHRDQVRLAVDLAGHALHQRGYRERGVAAPLRETLAAAMLQLAGWPALAAAGAELYDPVCGAGTLLIEGALMAGDVAPGLVQPRLGSPGWKGHAAALWRAELEAAAARREQGLRGLPAIGGSDRDPAAVAAARANLAAAGLVGKVTVARAALDDLAHRPGPGLVTANLPYGERLGDPREARDAAAALGRALARAFPDWHSAVLVADRDQAAALGVPARRRLPLRNGPLECELRLAEPVTAGAADPAASAARGDLPPAVAGAAAMLANRLRKNLRHLGRWARRVGVSCYRVYDADLPEFAFAADLYQGERRALHVQEYAPPAEIDPALAAARMRAAVEVLAGELELEPAQIVVKVRQRQRQGAQYHTLAATGERFAVEEGGHRFLVNLRDRLDTGLFLDHRLVRARVAELAPGTRFLNLFGYTGTATVYAAAAGARETTTVDLSAAYLDWARANLALNRLDDSRQRLIQADCLAWVEAARADPDARYELILLDPPTFSRSKRMQDTLDVQRDQERLLGGALALLAPGGVLIFSTNARRFRLDSAATRGAAVTDRTRETLPEDFRRGPPIHRCWELRPDAAGAARAEAASPARGRRGGTRPAAKRS